MVTAMMQAKPVIIIGAGVVGLALANGLKKVSLLARTKNLGLVCSHNK